MPFDGLHVVVRERRLVRKHEELRPQLVNGSGHLPAPVLGPEGHQVCADVSL